MPNFNPDGTQNAVDNWLEIASARHAHMKGVNKFGYSLDIDTSLEEIGDLGAAYSWPAAAATVLAVSADADDTAAGTGAKTIVVEGLDADYNEVSDTLTMAGLSNTDPSTVEFLRVHRAYVATAGTSLTNEGLITITGGAAVAAIQAGAGQTLMAQYTVPAGYTAYIINLATSTPKGDDMYAQLEVRPLGGAFNTKHVQNTYQTSTHSLFQPYVKVAAKSDIRVRGKGSVGNSEGAASFGMILVKN